MANNNTHAPGQELGYLRQIQQMFYELISLEPVTVSVEALDDVAVQAKDGSVIAEQLKSVTTGGNPIANRSPDLWKTLYNWKQYVINGDLPIKDTRFRLIVLSEKQIADGGIVATFNTAKSVEEARTAILNAQNEIWGKDGEKKGTIPTTYSEYLNAIFDSANIDIMCSIISQMTVIVYNGDYDTKLKEKFNSMPGMYPEFADKLYIAMFGWVAKQVVCQCKTGKPAYLHNQDFNAALVAQQRAFNQGVSIPALSSPIDDTVASGAARSTNPDTYIRQLEFIEADYSDKYKAATDFLRTKEEKTIRAEKGLFTTDSMNDYTDRLKQSWVNARKRTSFATNLTDIGKGNMLLSEVSDFALTARLQGEDLPHFFGSGTLHAMTNSPSDRPEIGWHPQYQELLKGGDSSDE